MTQAVDYYKILQVQYGAKRADITAAYRRLCKLYHPDVNDAPDAEEKMKQINFAYAALCDEPDGRHATGTRTETGGFSRAQGASEMQKASACIKSYFTALLDCDFARAYGLLSEYDRRFVSLQSFCEWRKAVQKLFIIRDFSIRTHSFVFSTTLSDGSIVPSVKNLVSITEKNSVLQSMETYQVSKLAIKELSGWHVFLGYRDLHEIAKVFDNLSAEQEKSEMGRLWDAYCGTHCRQLGMLNLAGLLQESTHELYRFRRYKQPLTVACFRIRPVSASVSQEAHAQMLECASKTIIDALRETDLPAYLENGIFAVLFVELRKRHAALITQRVTNKLMNDIQRELRMRVYAECYFLTYEGGDLRECIDKCSGSL